MKLKLSVWQRQRLYELLSNQNVGRAPIAAVQDMLDVRNKLDPSDLETDNENKEYELTFTDSQFNHLYKIATNPQVAWAIDDKVANLHEKLEEAKEAA